MVLHGTQVRRDLATGCARRLPVAREDRDGHPKATFDHVLGPVAVKGFLGEVAGKKVAILVYKEGKDAGKVATAIVPSPQQLMNWGIK